MFARCLAVVLCLATACPAAARELADAPEVRVVGFSADGRHFAYEQYLDDTVSGSVLASIDVIDRETGASAEGFPLGFLGMSKDGQYPMKVGNHDIRIDDSQPSPAQLEALRRDVRAKAQPRLEALGIRDTHRRLAGRAPTDRSAASGPIAFVTSATVPGAVPDQQPVYRLTTRVVPADVKACINGAPPRDHVVEIELATGKPGANAKSTSRTKASAPWPRGDRECAQSAVPTDILVQPGAEPRHVVVLMLAVAWAEHAEASRYLAAFVALP